MEGIRMKMFDDSQLFSLQASSLLESILHRYPRPLDAASACHLVLASIRERLAQERSAFSSEAAEVLGIDPSEVEEVGLIEAKRCWIEKATQDIIDELDPQTTIAGMMEVFGGRLDEDPTPELLAEIERRKQDLNHMLRYVTQRWTFTQVAYGIDALVGRSDNPLVVKQRIHDQYQVLQDGENLKTFFSLRSRETRSVSILLQEPSEVPPAIKQSLAETSKKQQRRSLIPLACDKSTFLRIVERLCELELLYSAEIENPRSAFFAHFSFQGTVETTPMESDPPKITWRGKISGLIAFFEWLVANEYMSESEGKRSSSLISKHFLRDGSPIGRNVVNSIKSVYGSGFEKFGEWYKQMDDILP